MRGSNQIHSLWRIKAFEPGSPEPLPFAGEGATSASISRQGNRLVFVQWSFDSDIWRVEIPEPQNKNTPPMKLISSTRVDHEEQNSRLMAKRSHLFRIGLGTLKCGSATVMGQTQRR